MTDGSFELLCHCCSHALGQDRAADLTRQASSADWPRVLALARRHGLQGILWLIHRRVAFLPPEQCGPVQHEQAKASTRALRQLAALREVVQEAQRRDLMLLVLKGPALSQDLYGSPTLRWARDLDLLCPPTQRAAARAVLEDLGYRRQPGARQWHIAYGRPGTGVLIELHTRLVENSHLLPEEPEIWWDGTRTLRLPGLEVRTLGADRQLIYLLLHGAGHAWSRLKWLLDLATMLEQAGPEAAVRISRHHGLEPLLDHCARLVEALFGYWPDGLPRRPSQGWRERRQFALALACLAAGNHLSTGARARALVYRLDLRPGWPYKVAALRAATRAHLGIGPGAGA